MVIKRKQKLPQITLDDTLDGIDTQLDYLGNHEYLGELKPVKKKTWQIKNITGGLRAFRKSKNNNN